MAVMPANLIKYIVTYNFYRPNLALIPKGGKLQTVEADWGHLGAEA